MRRMIGKRKTRARRMVMMITKGRGNSHYLRRGQAAAS